jgi:hypothetical protein
VNNIALLKQIFNVFKEDKFAGTFGPERQKVTEIGRKIT